MADGPVTALRAALTGEEVVTGHFAGSGERAQEPPGPSFLTGVLRQMSAPPDFLEVMLTRYNTMLSSGVLPRQVRELVLAWTSRPDRCPSCADTHTFFLQMPGGTSELVQALATAATPDDLPVDERTRELLRLLTTIAATSGRIPGGRWQRALDAGWTNEELLEALFCAALANFVTRGVGGSRLEVTGAGRVAASEPAAAAG